MPTRANNQWSITMYNEVNRDYPDVATTFLDMGFKHARFSTRTAAVEALEALCRSVE